MFRDGHDVTSRSGSAGRSRTASNLKCVCREHHLIKTFWGWQDQQLPDGTLIWTSPSGNVGLMGIYRMKGNSSPCPQPHRPPTPPTTSPEPSSRTRCTRCATPCGPQHRAARPEGQRREPGGDVDVRSVPTRDLRAGLAAAELTQHQRRIALGQNRGRFYVCHVNGSSTSADRPGMYCGTNPSGTAHWWICASHSSTSTRSTARTRWLARQRCWPAPNP